MTTNDLWHEVEVDPQAAALDTAKREARKALSPKVSFLMEASTREAFDDRLALIDGDIDRIVGAVASEPAVYALTRAAMVQDLNEMFGRGEARRRRDAEAKRARVARAMGPVVDESVLVARREARKTAASASYTNYTNMDSSFMRGYEKGDTLVRGYSGTVDDVLDSAADVIFGIHNRDDRPDGQMCPSMSVGDVINIDGKWVTVLGLGFADVEVDPADITTRSWLDVVRERRGSVKKAATQAEVDSWLAKQDPTFAEWAKPYAARMVYGPTYNRSIANNLPDAARAFNEGGMAGKQFRYVRSQLDAALGSERGEAWYWDEAQGEYTQRLQGTMAAKQAAYYVVLREGTGDPVEGPFDSEDEARQALSDYPDEYMVATSEQLGKESVKTAAVQVHEFETSGQAYNRVQTEDWIKAGDVLVIPSEKVVGIAFSAWPAAVTKARGHLHGFTDPTNPPAGESYDTPEEVAAWAEGWAKAREVAQEKGWPLATSGDDYEDEPGSENEWSFDASKKMAIKIDWSLSAWGCDGVTADGRWGINIFRNDQRRSRQQVHDEGLGPQPARRCATSRRVERLLHGGGSADRCRGLPHQLVGHVEAQGNHDASAVEADRWRHHDRGRWLRPDGGARFDRSRLGDHRPLRRDRARRWQVTDHRERQAGDAQACRHLRPGPRHREPGPEEEGQEEGHSRWPGGRRGP